MTNPLLSGLIYNWNQIFQQRMDVALEKITICSLVNLRSGEIRLIRSLITSAYGVELSDKFFIRNAPLFGTLAVMGLFVRIIISFCTG